MDEVGFVKSIRDFLIYLDGLPTIKVNDLVENEAGVRGWVSALLSDRVEVLLLDEGMVQPGQLFKRSGQKLTVPTGQFLLGRAINPLGVVIDGKGPLAKTKITTSTELEKEAVGIHAREFITSQFDTGITLVDTLIPLGKGQRELVLGDARSGKTEFLIETIINQKYTKTICIYASIGKPIVEVRALIDILQGNQALAHTVIVASSSTDLVPLIFLTPQTAMAIAEYFQQQGQDVLIILDDMGNHAKIYREIALLSNKSPGRESYPGDIFYQHSHLLERAGNFKKEAGGGSITALPVIELNLNDFTSFIPTNLMSMTDGHFLFKSSLYNQGQRPAIDIALSVSRVGQQTQVRIQNTLSTRIKQVLTRASQLETISHFSFELPLQTQLILKQKEIVEEMIKQPALTFIPKEIQTLLLALSFTKFLQDKDKDFVKNNQKTLLTAFLKDPELIKISQMVAKLQSEIELVKILEQNTTKLVEITTPTKTQNVATQKEANVNDRPN